MHSDETAETERAALAQQLHSLHETLAEMINAAEMRAAVERAADERAADKDLRTLAAEAADRRLKGLTDVAERGAREHVADHMPIRSFFNAAQTMLQQARTLAVEQDLECAYVLLFRFSTLFVEVLPTHAGFRSAEVAADRRVLIEEVSIVLEEAAHVKNVLRSRYLVDEEARIRAEVEVQQQAAAEEARIRAEVEVQQQAAAEAQAAANAAAEAAAANAARAAAAAAEARRVAEAEAKAKANSAAAASAALASAALACANIALARLAKCLRFSNSSTAASAAATSAASAAAWSTRDGWLL